MVQMLEPSLWSPSRFQARTLIKTQPITPHTVIRPHEPQVPPSPPVEDCRLEQGYYMQLFVFEREREGVREVAFGKNNV